MIGLIIEKSRKDQSISEKVTNPLNSPLWHLLQVSQHETERSSSFDEVLLIVATINIPDCREYLSFPDELYTFPPIAGHPLNWGSSRNRRSSLNSPPSHLFGKRSQIEGMTANSSKSPEFPRGHHLTLTIVE
jgi:hypothetical protein